MAMTTLKLVILSLTLTSVLSRPRETTHDLLSRLGFDPIQRPGVNIHKKRVAEESDKARNSASTYNTDTDSHMYVVKLPPHHPYYSKLKPEKLENEVLAERPVSFSSNGKPAQVYHWNIPLIKKLAKHKKAHKHESKIVHLKILGNENEDDSYYHKLRKDGKPSIYKPKSKDHVMSIKELAEQQNDMPVHKPKGKQSVYKDSKFTHILTQPKHNSHKKADSMLTFVKHSSHGYNDVSKEVSSSKFLGKTPMVYSPAIPKDNSFFKYFPGNGKPKSFYVIDKSENPSRFHRLL